MVFSKPTLKVGTPAENANGSLGKYRFRSRDFKDGFMNTDVESKRMEMGSSRRSPARLGSPLSPSDCSSPSDAYEQQEQSYSPNKPPWSDRTSPSSPLSSGGGSPHSQEGSGSRGFAVGDTPRQNSAGRQKQFVAAAEVEENLNREFPAELSFGEEDDYSRKHQALIDAQKRRRQSLGKLDDNKEDDEDEDQEKSQRFHWKWRGGGRFNNRSPRAASNRKKDSPENPLFRPQGAWESSPESPVLDLSTSSTPEPLMDSNRRRSSTPPLSPSAPPLFDSFREGANPDDAAGMSPLPSTRHFKASTWGATRGTALKEGGRWPLASPMQQSPENSPQRSGVGEAFQQPQASTWQDVAPPSSAGRSPFIYSTGSEAWPALVTYDACVRVCLDAAEQGVVEALQFLKSGALELRVGFGLQQVLLQPVRNSPSGAKEAWEKPSVKSRSRKRNGGVLELQVKRVKLNKSQGGSPNVKAGGKGSVAWLTTRMASLRSGPMDLSQEGLVCMVRLKSMAAEAAQRAVLGSAQALVLHPENGNDELVVEVWDSRGFRGGTAVPIANVDNDLGMENMKWLPLSCEGESEPVGKVQLALCYFPTGSGPRKGEVVGETLAFDTLLEVALRENNFQSRQLHLQGPWHWLLTMFADTYGVSQSYQSLRYLVHIMEVATPTEDCLLLVNELLEPALKLRDTLTRQEKRLLQDVEQKAAHLLADTFEQYKHLDESAPSGVADAPLVAPQTVAAPALIPAVHLFSLLHDVLSPESQTLLRGYFQVAARKRCRWYLADTDDVVGSPEEAAMDAAARDSAYARMRATCLAVSAEVRTDLRLHEQHIFPSFLHLPTITAEVYTEELNTRLRAFLRALPPSSPTPPVADLLHAAADLELDLAQWGIRPTPGVDTRELFCPYLEAWIRDVRMQLLELCRSTKWQGRWMPGKAERLSRSPFVEEMYEQLFQTLALYDGIMSRWPDHAATLEMAICDVERGIMGTLEKAFAEQIAPVQEAMGAAKKFTLHGLGAKLGRRNSRPHYLVAPQLGVLLNTIKWLLETRRPRMEAQMRQWLASLPSEGGNGQAVFGERLREVAVELRTKYKNILEAIVDKLCENTHLARTTHLKRILEDTKEKSSDDMSRRMQDLTTLLADMLVQLDDVLGGRVFVGAARGLWDRQAREVLHFLVSRKENVSWYKGSSAGIALQILDHMFTAQLQVLHGHALQEKDLEPPHSVMEARTLLARDGPNSGLDTYSFF